MVAFVLVLSLIAGVCSASPGRIVGGSVTNVLDYPGIVQVNRWDSPTNYWFNNCGGNILTENAILSAAHCFNANNPNGHSIRAGASIRNIGGVIAHIQSILIHPDYNRWFVRRDADIAILHLRELLVFGDTIAAVSIPPQGYVVPGNSPGVYAGWGFNYEETDILLHVDVNILSHAECQRRYGIFRRINQDVVCAGYDGKDACRGDSGGPLYFAGVLVGTVAWGPNPCGHPTRPGAAISVGYYTNWIVQNA